MCVNIPSNSPSNETTGNRGRKTISDEGRATRQSRYESNDSERSGEMHGVETTAIGLDSSRPSPLTRLCVGSDEY